MEPWLVGLSLIAEVEMVTVHCGGCVQEIELPPGTRSGDVIACPN